MREGMIKEEYVRSVGDIIKNRVRWAYIMYVCIV